MTYEVIYEGVLHVCKNVTGLIFIIYNRGIQELNADNQITLSFLMVN